MNEHKLWYVRRNQVVTGPFPEKVIQQHLLLGRLKIDDEVSPDVKQWHRLKEVDELIPDVMKADLSDPEARERFEAARRWADERLSIDRRTVNGPTDHPERRGQERRGAEDAETLAARQSKTELIVSKRRNKGPQRAATVIALAILVFLIWGGMHTPPTPIVEKVDCQAKPAPAVNWTSCQLKGRMFRNIDIRGARARTADFSGSDLSGAVLADADLAYANMSLIRAIGSDFRKATLVGVDFQLSNLTNSDFSGADLAYANLYQANLKGARFEGVRFDRTVWVDGSICAVGSVGQCLSSGEILR